MASSAEAAQAHWNQNPLFVSEEERYRIYPWLRQAAEFSEHRNHKILEVGCGTGCDLLQFAKHGAEAYGIDITEEHLRLAKQRVGSLADVRYGDGRAIPFPNATFDYVYSHGVLHHSDEPENIAAEILRVLKPDGRFNIQVYSLICYNTARLRQRFGSDWKHWTEGPKRASVFVEFYTATKLRRIFSPVPVTITKRDLVISGHRHLERIGLDRPFGAYIIAKGSKPRH
jgi:SAM-dependent methyltransferase